MNLLEAAYDFADNSGRIRTDTSRVTFMKVLKQLNRWAGGAASGIPLDELSADDLTDFCLSHHNDRPPAPKTILKRRSTLTTFYAWCAFKKYIDHDPASTLHFSVIPGRGGVRNHTWMSEDQTSDILTHKPDNAAGERDKLIVSIGVFTGLRAKEMANLTWDMFSDDLTELTLVGKGKKLATIAIPPQLGEVLSDWKKRRPYGATAVIPRMRWVFNPGAGKCEWVIDWSNPLGYAGILNAVKRVGQKFGIELRPHDLRRTFAGILEDQGVALPDISRAMRHENIGTTSGYLDRRPEKTVRVTSGFTIGGK